MAVQGLSEQLFQYSLIISAVGAALGGYYTSSFKNMIVTYGVGVFCSMMVVIPDWAFFRRPPSEWCFPMASDKDSALAQKGRFQILNSTPKYAQRFNFYPLRLIAFTLFYGYIIYRAWNYITS
uniref:Uncharacterized protein n=1 Tax=Araucaria cunninghamii TaxID=56994 RepID=A0A0D6R1T2_ARACU